MTRKLTDRAPKGGGKKGHHRPPVPKGQVDSIITSDLTSCPHCGSHDLKQRDPWILQQSDIPKIKPYITQIECAKALCNTCGRGAVAPLPVCYENSAFGPRISTFIGAA